MHKNSSLYAFWHKEILSKKPPFLFLHTYMHFQHFHIFLSHLFHGFKAYLGCKEKQKKEVIKPIMQSRNRNERNRKNLHQMIRKPKGSGLLKKAAALAVCAMAGATGSAFYIYTQGTGNVVINTVSDSGSIATSASSTGSAASVAKKISSSVVAITTENLQTSQSWFGAQVSGGAGSGVVVSKDGYIVTCAHVVNGASKIGVTTSDNKKYIAKVVGSDSSSDIADHPRSCGNYK